MNLHKSIACSATVIFCAFLQAQQETLKTLAQFQSMSILAISDNRRQETLRRFQCLNIVINKSRPLNSIDAKTFTSNVTKFSLCLSPTVHYYYT